MREDVEKSREQLASAVRDTRYSLDFPQRIQRSFRKQPVVWIAGAVLLGAVVMMMPRRKVVYVNNDKKGSKSKLVETGFLLGAVRIAATLLKPVVLNIVRQRISSGEWRFGRGPRN